MQGHFSHGAARRRIGSRFFGGLAAGVVAAALIAFGFASWAILAIALSRLADGLDGAIARSRGKSDFGGYLDITCDFLLICLYPGLFIPAAWIFGTLCFIISLSRLLLAAQIFRNAPGGDPL